MAARSMTVSSSSGDPTNAKAWWQLGDLYETTHQWDKLAQTLAKLVDLTSDDDVKALVHYYASQQ